MKPFLDRFKRNDSEEPASGDAAQTNAASAGSDQTAAPTAPDEEVTLQLGDFLHRIPAHFLTPGAHDPALELRFSLTEIANRIAQRETSIRLVSIYQRLPEIFQEEILETDQTEIRFPWQKVMFLINESATAGGDSLASKLKARCTVEEVPAVSASEVTEGDASAEATEAVEMATPPQKPLSWFARSARGMHAPPSPTSVGAPGGAQRSPKEYQRTITELNRRIIALEGTQKERAQELAKERELRLKVERQLASAERALQESATLLESTRSDGKRDLESDRRRRETETDRVHGELQKRIELLQEELGLVRRERDSFRDRLEAAGGTAAEVVAGWESRAVDQLEADITTYRGRITELIAEREALEREKLELSQEIEALKKAQIP